MEVEVWWFVVVGRVGRRTRRMGGRGYSLGWVEVWGKVWRYGGKGGSSG